jgi:hypothetical protein
MARIWLRHENVLLRRRTERQNMMRETIRENLKIPRNEKSGSEKAQIQLQVE